MKNPISKQICIVTNYSTTTNFGALLQSYALNKTIRSLGLFAEDLYYIEDSSDKKEKILSQLRRLDFKSIIKQIKSRIAKQSVRSQLDERKRIMDEFRFAIPHTEKFNRIELKNLQNRYDIFICGSDQIFRPNRNTDKIDGIFFLDMVNNGSTKASYAASIGIECYDSVNEKKAAEYLKSFDFISLREQSAADYISRITGRTDVETSVDPVFLIDRDDWINLSKPYPYTDKYILVYMIHGTEKLFHSIKEFAKLKNLKIITFPSMAYKKRPYEVNFANQDILDADPMQFIFLLNNAEYIFTDSFHGTAFSLILHKEAFVSRANEIAFSRIHNILGLFHAENLVIPADGLLPEQYLKPRYVDWKIVDTAIKEQQKKSLHYLITVINKKSNQEEKND